MAVQAQLYSDHYQNYYCYNNNNNIGCSNLSQDWVFINPSSSSYQHQENQRFLDSQKVMNFSGDYGNQVSSSTRFGVNEFYGLYSELDRQKVEMDIFVHHQNEKLKAVLNEETRKREIIMMHNYETKMKAILDAKDEVLNNAKMRTKELQNYLSIAEKESENWERKAMETEVMMTELNTKLKQAKAIRHEDAESVCGDNGDDYEEVERRKKMVCKVCRVRSSCVLLLPCKHLCCCRGCEGLLMFCPVCESVKNGSLEVFFGLN